MPSLFWGYGVYLRLAVEERDVISLGSSGVWPLARLHQVVVAAARQHYQTILEEDNKGELASEKKKM